MSDFTAKTTALQTAKAIAVLKIDQRAYVLLKNNIAPVDGWQNIVATAASIGLKNGASFIPFSPLVIVEGFTVNFALLAPGEESAGYKAIEAYVLVMIGEGKSIGRAAPGIEVMAGLSTALLTLFSILKEDCADLEVVCLKLLETKGGLSDRRKIIRRSYKVAVLVCSDGVVSGKKQDTAGQLAKEMLHQNNAEVLAYEQLGLQEDVIREKLQHWIEKGVPFIFTIGGTGPGKADVVTPIVTRLLEKELPGIVAAMYQYGISQSPKGMLSSLVAGVAGESVLVTLPGSTKGLQESLEAIIPDVFSFRKMIVGASK